ncbi:MAG: redox-sensing transcriptional repressor Rex [Tissierellia bacterium]|nr:redox-sensing transcriptional repressor Rex [Tissierellia bacterium]
MERKKVSITVIRRLPTYYRYLEELLERGIERISSQDLSVLTGFTASQIRQDLNNFGGFGQQGYGYNVLDLKNQIGRILGYDKAKKAVLIGAGKLGQTLASYKGFNESGMEVVGIFDRNPKNIGTVIEGVEIQDIKYAEEFLKNNAIDIGVITVSKEGAQDIADMYVRNGVRGIWNFAPVDIACAEPVYIENVRLTDSLLTLSYFLQEDNE